MTDNGALDWMIIKFILLVIGAFIYGLMGGVIDPSEQQGQSEKTGAEGHQDQG